MNRRAVFDALARNRRAMIALAAIALFAFAAVFSPILAPRDPQIGGSNSLQPPGAAGLMGTDHLGRDVFSQVLYGARVSLAVGLLSALSAGLIGTAVGSLSGFLGGWVDAALMRFSEFFQTLPRFVLALIIVALFGSGLANLIIVIAVLSWPQTARVARAQTQTLRETTFVEAARLSGLKPAELIVREILPNALPPIVVIVTLDIAGAILLEAGLGFFGLGDPNLVSWGGMLNQAQPYLRQAWWTPVFAGLAISAVVFAFNVLGDGLNDALNPRLRDSAG